VSRNQGTFIIPTGRKFEILKQNKFAEDTSDFNASPAVSDGELYLRSNKNLYCIAAGAAPGVK
jgi:hypothetical protein